jgi:hypothetical protein
VGSLTSPRREPGPPPRDVAAVLEILLAVCASEGGLLIALHEREDGGEGDARVEDEPPAAEQQRLSEDDREHRKVHRIAHEAVHTGDDETG